MLLVLARSIVCFLCFHNLRCDLCNLLLCSQLLLCHRMLQHICLCLLHTHLRHLLLLMSMDHRSHLFRHGRCLHCSQSIFLHDCPNRMFFPHHTQHLLCIGNLRMCLFLCHI